MQKLIARMLLPLTCVTLMCQAQAASGQTLDESYRSDILKLLETTGATKVGTQLAGLISGQIVAGLKKSHPEVPDRAVEVVQQVFDAEFSQIWVGPESLTEQLIPLYARHFTHDDVQAMLAFYDSPLGKKIIQVMPVLVQESFGIGQQWAEKQMPRITAVIESRLRADGLIK
jgi:hypothetical protein